MSRKIALIGVGKIALDQHVPAIAASPDWELAATVSRDNTVPGIENFASVEDMLPARPDIEVVSICLPPVPRFVAASAALRGRRHVMLEKPPGATLAECHTLEALARENNVSVYASWHSREAVGVADAKQWLADRKIQSVLVTWKENVRISHPGQEWIWQPGGFGVFDPGINALSIVTEILPDPIHLTSARLEVPSNCQAPSAADLEFFHPGGAGISMVFDFLQEGKPTWDIEVATDAGMLKLAKGGALLSIDGVETSSSKEFTLLVEYPRLYANWTRLVDSGTIDMDLAPMRHVADAFVLGHHTTVGPFVE